MFPPTNRSNAMKAKREHGPLLHIIMLRRGSPSCRREFNALVRWHLDDGRKNFGRVTHRVTRHVVDQGVSYRQVAFFLPVEEKS